MENVRDGVFTLDNRLFGITFTALDNVPLPHPDAHAFEVKDADGITITPIVTTVFNFTPESGDTPSLLTFA